VLYKISVSFMVENLSMPDLLKDVILIYFFCRALPIFFSVELHYP